MGKPEERLPTYEEVINEESIIPPPTPQRPQRPQQSQYTPNYSRPKPPAHPPQHGGTARPPQHPYQYNMNNTLQTSQNQSRLPWVYPPGYYCQKCGNTGYRIKDGLQCKKCWRQFARNSRPMINAINYGPPAPFGFNTPLILSPGDPRIGGYPCAECRGTGRVRFLLDQEICPVCRGVGRIFP